MTQIMTDDAFIHLFQTRAKERGAYRATVDGDPGPLTVAALDALIPALASPVSPPDPDQSAPPDPSDSHGPATLDDRSRRNLSTLHLRARALAHNLAAALADQGHTIQIISGTRTCAEQDALYAKGRTKPGPRVTNARCGHSNHNFGIAFDVGFFEHGKYLDAEADAGRFSRHDLANLYALAGRIGKDIGLEWGGDWKTFKDTPHFQLRPAWSDGMTERAMLAALREGRAPFPV